MWKMAIAFYLAALFNLIWVGVGNAQQSPNLLSFAVPENAEVIGYAGDAIGWANLMFYSEGEQPYFCRPSNLAITSDQYVSILQQYLRRHPDARNEKTSMLGMHLIKALREAFPCN